MITLAYNCCSLSKNEDMPGMMLSSLHMVLVNILTSPLV